MNVDKETLRKMENLARLELPASEEENMIKSLTDILTWVEHLDEVDTEGVEPLTTMSKEVNSLREDKAKNNFTREEGLKNAPDKDDTYIKVPKVLD